jgi:hypothetical protein
VAGRPITLNMNNMLQLANISASVLPPEYKTYGTADEWYLALAEMHIAQLVFQHNDLVSTKDDCRNKYVARQLFQRLAKQGRLSTFGLAEDAGLSSPKTNHPGFPKPLPSHTRSDFGVPIFGQATSYSMNLMTSSGLLTGIVHTLGQLSSCSIHPGGCYLRYLRCDPLALMTGQRCMTCALRLSFQL